MFGFLKDKLKGLVSKFTKKVETEAKEEVVEVEKEAPQEKKPKVEKKAEAKKVKEEKKPVEIKVEKPAKKEEKKPAEKKVEEKPKAKEEKKAEIKPKVEEKKIEAKKVEEAKPVVVPAPKVEAAPLKVEEKPIVEEKKGFFERVKEVFVKPAPAGPPERAPAIPEEPKVEAEKPKAEAPKERAREIPKERAPEIPEERAPEVTKAPVSEIPKEPAAEKGFFAKVKEAITTKKISAQQFDEMFWDLELALLENNAAVEVIEKIKTDLKQDLVEKPIARTRVQETIVGSLRKSIMDLFPVEPPDLLAIVKQKKPFIICFVGVNGSGKTTSIAKVAHLLKQHGLSVVLAAADTFRAAAIDQLQLHADKLGIRLIRHDYGSDPAAVAFDAIKHAQATNKDVVLIDTAGRLHSNTNLMDEMKKIIRVAKPDFKLFVGESITGNDCVEQAKQFDEAVGVDGIILAKADVDEKGGAAISVSYVTKKPILYLGVGQEYGDLQQFDKDKLIASIGL